MAEESKEKLDLPIGKSESVSPGMTYKNFHLCIDEAQVFALNNNKSCWVGMDAGVVIRTWVWYEEEFLEQIPAVLEVKPDGTIFPYLEKEG